MQILSKTSLAAALCAAFAQGGEVTGGNSQFYFVTALHSSRRRDSSQISSNSLKIMALA